MTLDKPSSISISTGTFLRILLIGLALTFLWFIRDVVAVLFVAVLLAALIDPFANWLAKRRLPRGLAVMLIYVLLAGIFVAVATILIPLIAEQLAQLAANLPTAPILNSLGHYRDLVVQYGLEENIRSGLTAIQSGASEMITSIFSTLRGAVSALATLVVVLVLAFYMVVENEAARRSFKHLAPEEYQPYLAGLFGRMQSKVGAWLRGQLLLGLMVGVAAYIGLLVLDVRYALLLAVIAGIFELLPYVGPILSVIPAALIAFGDSPFKALCVLLLYLIIQQLENHLLVPKVMQKATGLNPVISIIAILIGVKVGGFIGVFLSIPVATMISVLLEDLLTKPLADRV